MPEREHVVKAGKGTARAIGGADSWVPAAAKPQAPEVLEAGIVFSRQVARVPGPVGSPSWRLCCHPDFPVSISWLLSTWGAVMNEPIFVMS